MCRSGREPRQGPPPAHRRGRPAAATRAAPEHRRRTGIRAAIVDGRGQVLDARYNHGRYYPPLGTVTRSLPPDYRPYYRGGARYYFNGGVWYAPRGRGFVVVSRAGGRRGFGVAALLLDGLGRR